MKQPFDPERARLAREKRERENAYWVTRIKRMRRRPSAYSYRAILEARTWCKQQVAWMDSSYLQAEATPGEEHRISGILFRRAKLLESCAKLDTPLAHHRDQYNTLRELVCSAAEIIWSVEEEEGDELVPGWKETYRKYMTVDHAMSELDDDEDADDGE